MPYKSYKVIWCCSYCDYPLGIDGWCYRCECFDDDYEDDDDYYCDDDCDDYHSPYYQ